MLIVIKEITDKTQWENFVSGQKTDTFLQSWNWGEFNQKTGERIWRLGFFNDEKLAGVTLAIKINAKRGKFLFCPHGPIVRKLQITSASRRNKLQTNSKTQTDNNIQTSKILSALFIYLKDLAIKEKVAFVRISPLVENTLENLKIFQDYGFRNAPAHMMHPELSWILDISKTEEEIMKGMRKTTRNLVRRAEKEGVEISEIKTIDGVEEFYKLLKQTVGRHGFVPFSKDYLKNEFEALSRDNQISFFLAKHNGEILSSAIIVFYGDSAFYHHGASQASKIPCSYLLIWRIIQEAKKRGCMKFNFWGIAPENKPKHPWAGLTLFKTGFGGERQEYLHCQDLPITQKYWFNLVIETIRRWKKGY